jgi:hypothetical protein
MIEIGPNLAWTIQVLLIVLLLIAVLAMLHSTVKDW